jgi:hypothetical protein
MKSLVNRLAPSATEMLRTDHARVLTAFHRYRVDAAPAMKRAVAHGICLALDVHATLEEEIFYPAMRAAGSSLVDKHVADHAELHSLIATLQRMSPEETEFDATFMDLMRAVMHHVADEETTLLPTADEVMGYELGLVGARMATRRIQLLAARMPQLARNASRTAPGSTLLAAGAAFVAAFLFARRLRRS